VNKKIEVCMTPELIHLNELEGKIVVVVDILRATSCMTTALANGVQGIIPVATLEECKSYKDNGFICAAERGGEPVKGFQLDNSPFSYLDEKLKGKTIAVTTTNGTLAITKSLDADEVLVGSFLNLSSIANYLRSKLNNVIIHCAGWKGQVNTEDTLYAGALISLLEESFDVVGDGAQLAQNLYESNKANLLAVVESSGHAKRLAKFNILDDIKFCLEIDKYNLVPILKNGVLEKM
jgi:2-phosphosulfolactate phosphatase